MCNTLCFCKCFLIPLILTVILGERLGRSGCDPCIKKEETQDHLVSVGTGNVVSDFWLQALSSGLWNPSQFNFTFLHLSFIFLFFIFSFLSLTFFLEGLGAKEHQLRSASLLVRSLTSESSVLGECFTHFTYLLRSNFNHRNRFYKETDCKIWFMGLNLK